MPAAKRTYASADTVENEEGNALSYPMEILITFSTGSTLQDHMLNLKEGFGVMLLRKLDPKNELVN